jgi:hypothetical protein
VHTDAGRVPSGTQVLGIRDPRRCGRRPESVDRHAPTAYAQEQPHRSCGVWFTPGGDRAMAEGAGLKVHGGRRRQDAGASTLEYAVMFAILLAALLALLLRASGVIGQPDACTDATPQHCAASQCDSL